MPRLGAPTSRYSRSSHSVQAKDIVGVICHRKSGENEEFLIEWRCLTRPDSVTSPRAANSVLSWHPLDELNDCLHLVQLYLEQLKLAPILTNGTSHHGRKRKLSDSDEDPLARDLSNGLLTPEPTSHHKSRSPSVEPDSSFGHRVYNGVLEKKEGGIRPVSNKQLQSEAASIHTIDAGKLPTPAMLQEAKITPLPKTELAIREKFLDLLRPVKKTYLKNTVDRSTPSLDFTFIDDYQYMKGIYKTPPSTYEGCVKKCKPNMGGNIGCEYTKDCECLEYAPVDEKRLKKFDEELYNFYKTAKDTDAPVNTMGLPKRFPYSNPKEDSLVPQTLVKYYRQRRDMIYECNDNCKCGPRCKSRVVQKGRRVPLTTFKTPDRGWGVYCNEDLVQGEFIDTYLGEIITGEECDRREQEAGPGKDSYLFILDKCVGEQGLTEDDCYIVDGQHLGNATRFINHSCEPNCAQYAVSYDKNDFKLYNLAFFANEHIRAGTELTFDYMDFDELEEDEAIKAREEAEKDPRNKDRIKCNCGAKKCRGFLWKQDDGDDDENGGDKDDGDEDDGDDDDDD